jgi:2-hydroxy-6-oxonona-2,4-dienedioate hydrolase
VLRRVEFLFHHAEIHGDGHDELVTLRRSVYARPGFVLAVTNTPALQDPVVRKDFAWAPATRRWSARGGRR